MIAVVVSLVALFAYGYFLVGPANRGYSPRAWAFIATFLPFMYLLAIILSLVIGGYFAGSPVAPLPSVLIVLAYAAGVSLATGGGAGLRSYFDLRKP